MGFGEMVITEEKLRELDAKGWELYHVDEDFSETQEPGRRAPRQADRDDRALVRRGGQVQRAADRQPRHGAPGRGAAAARAAAQPATSTTRAPRWSRTRSPRASSTGRTASPRRSRSTNGAEGVLVAQGGSSGGYALYLKDHKLHYAYNFLGVQQFHVATDATVGDGRHELRFEFEPTGKPDLAHGKGTPARAQLYIDGKLAGAGRPAGHHPARHRHHRGAVVRPRRRLGGDDRLPRRRSRSRAQLEKVVVDVSGELHRGQGRRDALA